VIGSGFLLPLAELLDFFTRYPFKDFVHRQAGENFLPLLANDGATGTSPWVQFRSCAVVSGVFQARSASKGRRPTLACAAGLENHGRAATELHPIALCQ
jgi:hypothetical protein